MVTAHSKGLGLSAFRTSDQGSTGIVVKASAGQVFGIHWTSDSATLGYLHLYDLATSAATSDVPIFTRAATSAVPISWTIPGLKFSNGISIRGTCSGDYSQTGNAAGTFGGTIVYA
jgi:hypothetical protein